jgi:hypothetical protein
MRRTAKSSSVCRSIVNLGARVLVGLGGESVFLFTEKKVSSEHFLSDTFCVPFGYINHHHTKRHFDGLRYVGNGSSPTKSP